MYNKTHSSHNRLHKWFNPKKQNKMHKKRLAIFSIRLQLYSRSNSKQLVNEWIIEMCFKIIKYPLF